MSSATRWIFATVNGIGDICFETSQAIFNGSGYVDARNICRVTVGKNPKTGAIFKEVSKWPAYEVGLVQESKSVRLGESMLILTAIAPPDMAEAARKCWSEIEVASQIPKLADNNRFRRKR